MSVLTYAMLPVASAIGGSVVAVFKPPEPKLRSAIQHFAAGVVFSVVAVELLPDVIREHKPINVVIGFIIGVAAMLLTRSLTGNVGESSAANLGRLPSAMLAAIAVDLLIDGFLIGIGFTAGVKEGKLLTLALTVELLSLGLAASVALRAAWMGRGKTIITISLLALLVVVGSVIGATLLQGISHGALELILSFGLAALLFLVTEELLVEAHEVPETPWTTATFFAGFLLFLVLGMTS